MLVLLLVGLGFLSLWIFVFLAPKIWPQVDWLVNLSVTKRNLILPSAIFISLIGLIGFLELANRVFKRNFIHYSLFIILLLSSFDLLRFAKKFTPFVKSSWFFPPTETIKFLKQDSDIFRFITTDRRIFPPNFSIFYRLQTVEGYDPLYLKRYGELVAAWERGKPDISPFSFNRILRPGNFQSRIADLLNVKYVLSLSDLNAEKLELVFREGQTRVYWNKNAFPRAFLVYEYKVARNKQEAMNFLFSEDIDLRKTAIVEEPLELKLKEGKGKVKINDYQPGRIVIEVEMEGEGILVLTESFYPSWKAYIGGEETRIFRTDYNFLGIVVSKGKHRVVFQYD